MKNIPIVNSEKFAIVDDEDYAELSKFTWFLKKGYASRSLALGYEAGKKKVKTLSMSRVITEAKDGEMVDHANRNPLDNRRSNLRIATPSQSASNRVHAKKNEYRGVKKEGEQWIASVCKDYVRWREKYPTMEEAARAYDRKARELHGKFAILNFPSVGD